MRKTLEINDTSVENIWNYLIYLRKSRSDSPLETVEEVLARHEKILQEMAVRKFGHHIPEENIYREVVSGETIADRPEMNTILERIESSNIKGVLVVDPQRLSRGDLIDCGTIIRAFKYTNTVVLTPPKDYDLNEKYDEKFFKDELMRGSEYLEYTKEILNRGKLASVSEGNYIGSIPPYGYDRDVIVEGHRKCPTLKINEHEANVVRMVFDMYANQNIAPYTIAEKLDEMGVKPRKAKHFSQATVKDMLTNQHYLGKVVWNRHKTQVDYIDREITKSRPRHKEFLIFDGKHPAIIDQELFDKAQERKGKNPCTRKDGELRNPLARLLFCQCGRSMSYRTYKDKDGRERNEPRCLCQDQTRCGTRSVTFSRVYEAVIVALEQHLEDFEMKLKNGDDNSEKLQNERLANIQSEIDEINAQMNKLFDFVERGIYDEETFSHRRKTLLTKKEELSSAYNKIASTLPKTINYEEKIVKLSETIEALKDKSISARAKNNFLTSIVEKIVYTPEVEGKGNRWSEFDFILDVFLRL